jgi:hypothetical protein
VVHGKHETELPVEFLFNTLGLSIITDDPDSFVKRGTVGPSSLSPNEGPKIRVSISKQFRANRS